MGFQFVGIWYMSDQRILPFLFEQLGIFLNQLRAIGVSKRGMLGMKSYRLWLEPYLHFEIVLDVHLKIRICATVQEKMIVIH